MKPIPQLKNDFILNDQEYRMKALVEEYETNWRGQVQR
jgi:hypothetical protein